MLLIPDHSNLVNLGLSQLISCFSYYLDCLFFSALFGGSSAFPLPLESPRFNPCPSLLQSLCILYLGDPTHKLGLNFMLLTQIHLYSEPFFLYAKQNFCLFQTGTFSKTGASWTFSLSLCFPPSSSECWTSLFLLKPPALGPKHIFFVVLWSASNRGTIGGYSWATPTSRGARQWVGQGYWQACSTFCWHCLRGSKGRSSNLSHQINPCWQSWLGNRDYCSTTTVVTC